MRINGAREKSIKKALRDTHTHWLRSSDEARFTGLFRTDTVPVQQAFVRGRHVGDHVADIPD